MAIYLDLQNRVPPLQPTQQTQPIASPVAPPVVSFSQITNEVSHIKFDEKKALALINTNINEFFEYLSQTKPPNNLRYKLAQTMAKEKPYAMCENIKKFNIRKESQRHNLATILANRYPGKLCYNINSFELTEQHLFDLAVQLSKSTSELFNTIDDFKINEPFSFAKIVTDFNPGHTAFCIKKFNLNSDQCFFLAKMILKKQSYNLMLCYELDKFNLTTEQRLQLAEKLVEVDPVLLYDRIDVFIKQGEKILFAENPEKRQALAETFINAKPLTLCRSIKQLGIFDSEKRFELAKIALEKDSFAFCGHAHNFDLSKEQLTAIGEILIKEKPSHLCFDFDNFTKDGEPLFANDENKRLALAYAAAEISDGSGLCINFKKLNIQDIEQRFAIAKKMFRNSTTVFKYKLNNFELNQEQLCAIADMAEKDARFVACFKDFNILDENKRLSYLIQTIENGAFNCREFENFDIQDKSKILEFVDVIIKKDPLSFLYYLYEFIKKHGIEIIPLEKRFVLAKAVAEQDPNEFCRFLKYLNIPNNDPFFSLTQMIVEKKPEVFFQNINMFNLKEMNDQKRFSLAKIMGEKAPSLLGSCIREFKLDNMQQLIDELTPINSMRFVFSALTGKKLPKSIKIDRKAFFHNLSMYDLIQEEMMRHFYSTSSFDKPHLRQIIEKNHTTHIDQATGTLENFLILCELFTDEDPGFLDPNHPIIADIFSIRDIHLLSPLLLSFLDFSCVETIPKDTTPFSLLWKTVQNRKHPLRSKDLRDNLFANPLMHLLITVRKENLADCTKIFDWILESPKNKKQVLARGNVIRAICNFQGASRLPEGNYEQILLELTSQLLPEIKDCTAQQLQDTFLSSRNPHALFTYAGRLATLKNKGPLAILGAFVREVALGEYPNSRRDNVHLKKLHEICPHTLKDFHQGAAKTQQLIIQRKSQKVHLKIQEILRNAFNDNHIRDEDLVGILDIPKEEQNFAAYRNNSIKNLEEKIAQTENNHYLKLQLYLLQLTQKDVTFEKYQDAVRLITPFFKKDSVFVTTDLPSLAKLFMQTKDRTTTIYLNDTDDPYDILLCGTEVEGSCQRIDGSPNLNRGLLGYLLNGQTRLLTIKENVNGPIKARAIFRLLLNQNDQPALFFERIYPQTLQDDLREILTNFALERGAQLGLSVYHSGNEAHEKLHSLGGRASEYIDGASGISKNAQYKIKSTSMLK